MNPRHRCNRRLKTDGPSTFAQASAGQGGASLPLIGVWHPGFRVWENGSRVRSPHLEAEFRSQKSGVRRKSA